MMALGPDGFTLGLGRIPLHGAGSEGCVNDGGSGRSGSRLSEGSRSIRGGEFHHGAMGDGRWWREGSWRGLTSVLALVPFTCCKFATPSSRRRSWKRVMGTEILLAPRERWSVSRGAGFGEQGGKRRGRLQCLSSTHRMLHDIARPLGFTEFTLHTYLYGFQPQQARLDDALERLRFWTSPRIAPHRLDARDIRFTRTGITNLCGLPALTSLEILGVTILNPEHVDPALTLRVARFTMRLPYQYMEDIWFTLLSRDTLRELDLPRTLVLARSDVGPFPNVHSLRTDRLPDMIHVVETFNKFPNLRSFSNPNGHGFRNLTPAQESSIFPGLKKYTGVHQNLRIFGQRDTLTHITLVSNPTFADFITELHGITTLPNIAFFAGVFITSDQVAFDKAEIGTLFTLFPNLTELQLTLLPSEPHELLAQRTKLFLKMLPSSPLPSSLHSLSFRWDLAGYKSGGPETDFKPHAADMLDFPALRAELVAKCPALACIFLDGYHFLFLWRKTSSM
ncbi:hypothetical protein C8R45DRAFT_1074548 [Mycena sanguinolenta]|nr:hypothetical protein C8R45DRAFT_1074548 [Mycena sanguinolenta]